MFSVTGEVEEEGDNGASQTCGNRRPGLRERDRSPLEVEVVVVVVDNGVKMSGEE